ncbi:MAG: 3-dehydroquinate synthase [Bacteroidales bacterium]|nr:3-dehydroquinate synthase [Bacteroidales bacterium]
MTLHCHFGQDAYDIRIGRGLLAEAGRLLDLRRKVMVVTDSGVPEDYARTILRQCREGSLLTIPQGEGAKTPETLLSILDELLRLGFTRSDAVVAVGGGVVGDIAGFAAAVYQRGIEYYNVPTTLLSQVDSSVGGKTAVNFRGVKNIVGAFHNPSAVLIDPDTLLTLDTRLFAEGVAEVVKMAATSDAGLFSLLEQTPDLVPVLPEVIASALRIKIDVVAKDPQEKGLRAVLNFGHTIGHAIEAASAKTPAPFYHGEAVAAGMMYTSEGEARSRIARLLVKFGLPTSDPFGTDELLAYALKDKKRSGAAVKLVLVDKPGEFRFEWADEDSLRQLIQSRK